MFDEGLLGSGDGILTGLYIVILVANNEASQVLVDLPDGFSGTDCFDRLFNRLSDGG